MKRAAIAGLAVLGLITGCSAAHTTPIHHPAHHPVAAVRAAAPDPAALLRKIGATSVGNTGTDIYGDLNASGQASGGGEQFDVYTNASDPALQQHMANLLNAPGSQAVIDGYRFVITATVSVSPDGGNNEPYTIKPAAIAKLLHGQVVWPGQ